MRARRRGNCEQARRTSWLISVALVMLAVRAAGADAAAPPTAAPPPAAPPPAAPPTAAPPTATAPPIIVLKARVGLVAPADADAASPVIDAQFEAEGFAARPATILRLLGGRMPRPGILDRGVSAADLMRPIELGYDDWSKGLFATAEQKLIPAKQRILRNPGLLVTDTKNLDSTFKGLVALALSQARLGKASESAQTMIELIRMFRTRPISRADWGRPAEEYWRAIAKPVLAAGAGQLYVTTGNPHAVVFVDGQIRGIGSAEVADLVPGTHHVFVQVPATAGLQYEVQIKANENANLEIRWDIDTALEVREPWIGLVFATEVERAREALLAGELARRWGGRGMVVVVDTLRIQGEPMVIGTLYRAGGKIVRSAATALTGDPAAQVRQLARYLADGTVGTGLRVIDRERRDDAPAAAATGPAPRARWLAGAIGGAGAIALVAGSYWYLSGAGDDGAALVYDDRKVRGVQVAVGGSAALGTGMYLWLRASTSAGVLPSAALGAGTASLIAGGVLVFTDEDASAERRYYRESATVGAIAGAAGLAMTGLGLWLLHREDGAPRGAHESTAASAASPAAGRSRWRWAPTITIEASRSSIGVAGTLW